MRLDTIDLRQLRVFLTVADCRGFSTAQAELNISVSTISTQMSDLETRLGLRLCQRGRSGFSLTKDGERVYKAAQTLFRQIDGFNNEVYDLRQELSGKLSLGLADNLVTHPTSPITQALEKLFNMEGEIEILINVLSPNLLERELLEQRLDIVIGAFPRHLQGINYQPLFDERQSLYCGSKHSLFAMKEKELQTIDLKEHRIAQRGYTAGRPHPSNLNTAPSGAISYHMEGLVYLVLSGHFLAHLPDHYAEKWVNSGEIKSLYPQSQSYISTFEIASRAGTHPSPVLRAFLKGIVSPEKKQCS
ncbi:LysR family transcriptional regulator [Kiloniella antarctica]|uniref:LysR family transcriptional regulator n=1 Tax=Kiloniella antarctica TaxID=1550907 RepID=A0ABW5BPH4_9PROT